MTEKQIEQALESIVATAKLEGYKLPDDVVEKCKCILLGELDPEEEIKKIKKYFLERGKDL